MEAQRSTEASVTINHAKLRREDLTLQEMYYDGIKSNYHYCDSGYNLPFINFFQNMAWFHINFVFIYLDGRLYTANLAVGCVQQL
jgi:hypothetical protein